MLHNVLRAGAPVVFRCAQAIVSVVVASVSWCLWRNPTKTLPVLFIGLWVIYTLYKKAHSDMWKRALYFPHDGPELYLYSKGDSITRHMVYLI